MKILVLNGSPKRDKSDTMHITRAFLDGMNEVAENEIKTIHVIDKNIEYCSGCFACMRNGGDCIHHDDMRGILEEILDSDLLIWSYPLYCYGMPAPLKALCDRTMPLSSAFAALAAAAAVRLSALEAAPSAADCAAAAAEAAPSAVPCAPAAAASLATIASSTSRKNASVMMSPVDRSCLL